MSGHTQESIRLAVDAMMSEWDEWAAENQGTRECFEASLRAALSPLQPSPDPARSALVEAMKRTWQVIDSAGLLNLSNGVQLGQTSWYVKASDARNESIAALLAAGEGL